MEWRVWEWDFKSSYSRWAGTCTSTATVRVGSFDLVRGLRLGSMGCGSRIGRKLFWESCLVRWIIPNASSLAQCGLSSNCSLNYTLQGILDSMRTRQASPSLLNTIMSLKCGQMAAGPTRNDARQVGRWACFCTDGCAPLSSPHLDFG